MKRDLYIDFAKGFATLAIIFIHTVFWSGQFYIPTPLRTLSLLIDVPLFYALSGITSGNNLEKTFYRLLKLQITYMIFVTLLFAGDYLFKLFGLNLFGEQWLKDVYATFGEKFVPKQISAFPQWENLGNWYLHSYSSADTFPVVMGSFWYLKVYFILTVFGVLILKFFPKHINWFIGVCFFLTVVFNVFPQYYPSGQVGYVAFYLGIFLIANKLKGKTIPKGWIPVIFIAVAVLLALMFSCYGADIFFRMNKQKFPPKFPYIVWALPALSVLFVLYNRVKISKESLVTYIGQNAIFFYFAQGISSSLAYFIAVPLKEKLPWYALMIIVYIINIILAIGIAKVLKQADAAGWKVLELLRRKTAGN